MPKKKYKLRCFYCGQNFRDKSEVFRGKLGYPLCEECIYEEIALDFFADPDQIIEQLKSQFNNNYKKLLRYLKTECKICPECNTWTPKDEFIENICQNCFDNKIVIPEEVM